MSGATRRSLPLALVAAAHAALGWGLWHAVIGQPGAGQAAPAAWWVVQARVLPEVSPPLLPSPAPPRPAAVQAPDARPVATRAVALEPAAPMAAASPTVLAAPPAAEARVPVQASAAPVVVAAAPETLPSTAATRTAPRERMPPDNSPCGRAPYPVLLQERGIEGTLRLRVHVAADGRATQVQLLASSGFRLFDEAALAQARGCRFRPARWGDEAVDEWVEYPVRFSLQG